MWQALKTAWDKARGLVKKGQDWAARHLPPGVRLLAGLLLIVGGVFSFLPVLGLWMLPLGVAVAALDVVPMWRWLTGRRLWHRPGRR